MTTLALAVPAQAWRAAADALADPAAPPRTDAPTALFEHAAPRGDGLELRVRLQASAAVVLAAAHLLDTADGGRGDVVALDARRGDDAALDDLCDLRLDAAGLRVILVPREIALAVDRKRIAVPAGRTPRVIARGAFGPGLAASLTRKPDGGLRLDASGPAGGPFGRDLADLDAPAALQAGGLGELRVRFERADSRRSPAVWL